MRSALFKPRRMWLSSATVPVSWTVRAGALSCVVPSVATRARPCPAPSVTDSLMPRVRVSGSFGEYKSPSAPKVSKPPVWSMFKREGICGVGPIRAWSELVWRVTGIFPRVVKSPAATVTEMLPVPVALTFRLPCER